MSTTLVCALAETIQNSRNHKIPTTNAVLIAKVRNAYLDPVFRPADPALQYAIHVQQAMSLTHAFGGKYANVADKTLEILSQFGRQYHDLLTANV